MDKLLFKSTNDIYELKSFIPNKASHRCWNIYRTNGHIELIFYCLVIDRWISQYPTLTSKCPCLKYPFFLQAWLSSSEYFPLRPERPPFSTFFLPSLLSLVLSRSLRRLQTVSMNLGVATVKLYPVAIRLQREGDSASVHLWWALLVDGLAQYARRTREDGHGSPTWRSSAWTSQRAQRLWRKATSKKAEGPEYLGRIHQRLDRCASEVRQQNSWP